MTTRRARVVLLALTGVALVAPSAARAEDKAECIASFEGAAELRVHGKLLEARQRLVDCAGRACPADVQRECAKELESLASSLPSVVVRASDERERDLVDARVTLDGAPTPVDGLAVPLDPGRHTVRFEAPGCAPREDELLLAEGERNRAVVGVLRCETQAAPAEPARASSGGAARGALTIALAAVGAAGLVSMTYFGLHGRGRIEDIRATGCAPACDVDQVHRARTDLVIADVSGAIGVVALGAAAWLYFTRPAARAPAATFLDVSPGARGATLRVRGVF